MRDISFPFYNKSHIKLQHIIGEGYIGKVYSGSLTVDSETIPCVIKQVSSANYDNGIHDSILYQDMIDEIKIGKQLMGKTKYQIQFYGYSIVQIEDEVIIYLLMEKTNAQGDIGSYISNNDLWISLNEEEYYNSPSYTILQHEGLFWDYTFPVNDKLNLIYKMCIAVQELHTFKIVHCDIKPSNMLFTGKEIKLIDYNASHKLNDEIEIQGSSELGTPGYMAKEMYDGWISYKADIYSLGVSMLELWFGDIWSRKSDCYKINRKSVLDYLSILKKDNFELHTLIKKCISVEPKKRPILKNILSNLDHIQTLQYRQSDTVE